MYSELKSEIIEKIPSLSFDEIKEMKITHKLWCYDILQDVYLQNCSINIEDMKIMFNHEGFSGIFHEEKGLITNQIYQNIFLYGEDMLKLISIETGFPLERIKLLKEENKLF
jgi:hypothetical protein